jgi:hypothetical protein
MNTINNIADLNNAILALENEQTEKGRILRNQFYLTYESLKPVNLLSSTLRDLGKSPTLGKDLGGTALALAAGFVSRRIFVGGSGNLFKRILGTFVQYGISNLVSRNQDDLKTFGQGLLQNLFKRREKKVDTDDE